ncbi:mycofactocin system transcriptional regulator [Nocardioides sp.]|uniref:mycofactocin system transcriptional regulator n=1 Tax=Nocardioides sp. TaxID=35761 RepID=UPI003D147B55
MGVPETSTRRSLQGRPVATNHSAIEEAAFRLFAERGFEGTTLDAIAREVGVGRRTLFRYFDSKNDIPWGRFDLTLAAFRDLLDDLYHLPIAEAVHLGVRRFNDFPPDASPHHADRMRLILETPTLQAHSVLRYGEWRAVIAEYVARRTGGAPSDLMPQTVGQVSLALALSAYTVWLEDTSQSLLDLVDAAMAALRAHLADVSA